jgi:hypothetical protein
VRSSQRQAEEDKEVLGRDWSTQESHCLFRKEKSVQRSKFNQFSETALLEMKIWGWEIWEYSSGFISNAKKQNMARKTS